MGATREARVREVEGDPDSEARNPRFVCQLETGVKRMSRRTPPPRSFFFLEGVKLPFF